MEAVHVAVGLFHRELAELRGGNDKVVVEVCNHLCRRGHTPRGKSGGDGGGRATGGGREGGGRRGEGEWSGATQVLLTVAARSPDNLSVGYGIDATAHSRIEKEVTSTVHKGNCTHVCINTHGTEDT